MEVESSATAAITASTNTPTEEETMQETSAMAEGLIQGKKRAASVDDDEEADQGKLVIDEQLDNQAKKEQGATDAKEDGTEGQGTSQDDGAAEGSSLSQHIVWFRCITVLVVYSWVQTAQCPVPGFFEFCFMTSQN